jgi:putative intracellular protease/amidase/pimeloyl-ACP methyl ester carboxylesterase
MKSVSFQGGNIMKRIKNGAPAVLFACIIAAALGCGEHRAEDRVILMVMADKDFYDPEYTLPRERLEAAGFRVETANVSGGTSAGIDGLAVRADCAIKDADASTYAALLLVGGYGAESLYDNKELINLAGSFAAAGKVIGAQCFSPVVLAQAGLLRGRKASCWPTQASKLESYGVTYTGEVTERAGNILTGPSGNAENIAAFIEEYERMLGMNRDVVSGGDDSMYLRVCDPPGFDEIHSPVNGSENEYLILGNIPVMPPAESLPNESAAWAGRWEGYALTPPVSKDVKIVLVIREITEKYAKGFVWHTTNLQFPFRMHEFKARLLPVESPVRFEMKFPFQAHSASPGNILFTYNKNTGRLVGEFMTPDGEYVHGPGEIVLSRGNEFRIYKDYDTYLAGKRIYVKDFREKNLRKFGKGFMVYLPRGYEERKKEKWPLLVFLHGSGDRGDNIHLIAKASPFLIVREKQDVPLIIAAPLLADSGGRGFFPTEYVDDFLAQTIKEYRVDETRVYLTGLSMGGEATYRYAASHPERVAALAPLCAPMYTTNSDEGFKREGRPFIERPIAELKNTPVWIIGGGKDTIVPKEAVIRNADAVRKAGANVKLTILEDNDHDVWTDMYGDPAFYDWFLQYRK